MVGRGVPASPAKHALAEAFGTPWCPLKPSGRGPGPFLDGRVNHSEGGEVRTVDASIPCEQARRGHRRVGTDEKVG